MQQIVRTTQVLQANQEDSSSNTLGALPLLVAIIHRT